MATWADRCESVWLDSALLAVVLTGLTALAMIQSRQPARRRIWGRCGLVASLALVPLVTCNPLPRVNLKHPTWIFRAAGAGPTGAGPDASTQPGADSGPIAARDLAGATWPEAARRSLMVAYGLGVAFGMARLGLGWAGVAYLAGRSEPASPRAEALLDSLPCDPRRRRPRVRVSARLSRPALVGIIRPVILIPPDLDRSGQEPRLRLGLLHELAHFEVHDHWYGPVAGLAQAWWFFLPQAWWVRNQLGLDAEYLADHRAVGHYGTSYHYAESLVGLAFDATAPRAAGPDDRPGPLGQPRRDAEPGGGLASALLQRVQMLLKCPFEVEDRPPRAWTGSVAAFMAGITLAGSCLSIRDDPRRLAPPAGGSPGSARAFHLAELMIAPDAAQGRPFDLRFPLPDRFRLACEILARPAELGQLEILGYPLASAASPAAEGPGRAEPASWWRVVIIREFGGLESVQVAGTAVVTPQLPARPATWLTIRPIPHQATRIRSLRLTW